VSADRRRSFISRSLCCFQLIEARGCCKPSPDPQLISYLHLLLLSCYRRCCFCLGSQPALGDALPAQPAPGSPDLSLPGCVSAGTRSLAAAPCWKLGPGRLPCYLHPVPARERPPQGCQLSRPRRRVCVPRRERERERTRSRVTNRTREGAKQTGTSRGRVLAADGLCAERSLGLLWVCVTVRSISPSGTRLEESH